MSKVLLDALKGLDIDKILIENVASMPKEERNRCFKVYSQT